MANRQFTVALWVPTLALAALIVWQGPAAIDTACAMAAAEKAAGGCLEFWLNRYQTLAAGVLALLAAGIAVRPVYRQLGEMTRQSAAGAIPNLRVIATELEQEMPAMKLADRQLEAIDDIVEQYDTYDFNDIYQTWPDQVSRLAEQVFTAWQILSNRRDRDPSSNVLADSRLEGVICFKHLIDVLADFSYAFKEQTSGPDYELGEPDLDRDEVIRRRAAVISGRQRWINWYQEYIEIALSERRTAWSRVRDMERVAVGGHSA